MKTDKLVMKRLNQFLSFNTTPAELAADLRRIEFSLSQYCIQDENCNGTLAQELAGSIYYLHELSELLHPCGG